MDEKAFVKEMQQASPDVLRQTARDVFEDKILASGLGKNANGNTNGNSNGSHEKYADYFGLPEIDVEDLTLGRVLGRGAFCVVYECANTTMGTTFSRSIDSDRSERSILSVPTNSGIGKFGKRFRRARKHSDESSDNSSLGSSNVTEIRRRRPARRQSVSKSGEKYVLKKLSPELARSDKINFLKGTVDLAMETRFLAKLDHENIVSITGVSSSGAFSDGYFIVLEKLNETLGKRVKTWMDLDRQCKGITGVFTGSKKKTRRLKLEQISAARNLAAGMEYLHQQNVVFRDLKPDNVGFTTEGILKIFDFGLAKELRDDERVEGGFYNMTGCTGAIRYMSPENLQGKPYNLKTDVYSWAMIMWNILALEPPFALYTEEMIIDRATRRGYRPKIFSTWSDRMTHVMKKGWSANPNERPAFSEIATELMHEEAEIDKAYPEV